MESTPYRAVVEVARWLVDEARALARPEDVLGGLADRLRGEGVRVERALAVLFTLHPLVHGRSYRWALGEGTSTDAHPHGMQDDPAYAASPVRAVRDGEVRALRRRLADPREPMDFPLLGELRAAGWTDYLVLPMRFSDGSVHVVSWATREADGFRDADAAALEAIVPTLSLILELIMRRSLAGTLLQTYLGREAGSRVLRGQIRRGDGEGMAAVVWMCDLRGFTASSDRLPRERLLDLLDAYFDTVVNAIHAQGGEVLKFIGDAVLAVFRYDGDAKRSLRVAARAALDAAAQAVESAAARNKSRANLREPTIEFGIALHVGDVTFGNIGAADRLDFTVIGPAVNLAARIERQCAALGRHVLVSEAFADALGGGLEDLGRHALRGIEEPVRLFAAPEPT